MNNESQEIHEERPHAGYSHSFDVGLAAKYGMECAVIINHIAHWIDHNRENGKNFKEGHTWMYQSRKEMASHFPYLNEEQVRYFTDKLVDEGVLIKGNYNKSAIDKTLWYTFKNEKMFTKGNFPKSTGKIPNRDGKIPKPIPNTKTHIETKEDTLSVSHDTTSQDSENAKECVSFFLSKIREMDPNFKLPLKKETLWIIDLLNMRLKDNRSWDEIKQLIEFSQRSEFWRSRAITPLLLRKHATTILTQMKSPPKLDNAEIGKAMEKEKEKEKDILIEKNKKIARIALQKFSRKYYVILADGIRVEFRHRNNIALYFEDENFEMHLAYIINDILADIQQDKHEKRYDGDSHRDIM